MLLSLDALWVLLGALLLDALVGDPERLWRRWPHPVALIGRVIGWADARFNRADASAAGRRSAGLAVLLGLVLGAAGSGWLVEMGLRTLPGGPLWVALAASVLLAQRSLHEHVARVGAAFAEGLPAARRAVSAIVGRDPERLDEAGVCRAAIESAAENASDGVVAPVLWFAIAGLPGLLVYKSVNTADSMIGYLSDRHRDFGWAAARSDDGLNLVPARLSGIFVCLAGRHPGRAFRTMWRDAALHRSPNAGWPEAAAAGSLGLRLGGPRIYAAGPVAEPFLNPGGRDAEPADIGRTLSLLRRAAILHAGLWVVLAMLSWP